MSSSYNVTPDPTLDLVLERVVDVPKELVWTAWTTPKHIYKWFVPKPWTITDCEIDLRPGGIFRTTMQSPEGQSFPNCGCYLEIVPNERLVWTDALLPGYRPSPQPFFTAVLTLKSEGKGTRYTAMAIHRDEAGKKQHESMGFHEGWGTVLDQLVEYIKTM
ncbi:MAG TPA: SRPBCC family protein [Candidatus Hydrogenedentes bacterium]|nr:SRPBCC family protein [Candidatus Hydrogenedentota bacterium]HRK33633.1 SRPBCC family protein [Candidatus Hydrogenedentota bacterium]